MRDERRVRRSISAIAHLSLTSSPQLVPLPASLSLFLLFVLVLCFASLQDILVRSIRFVYRCGAMRGTSRSMESRDESSFEPSQTELSADTDEDLDCELDSEDKIRPGKLHQRLTMLALICPG